MGVAGGAAQAGKVFAAPDDASVLRDRPGIRERMNDLGGSGATERVPMTSSGFGQGEIDDRGEGGVEAEGAHGACDDLAEFASEGGPGGWRAALQTAWAEGRGASASRRRFTVPPSTST